MSHLLICTSSLRVPFTKLIIGIGQLQDHFISAAVNRLHLPLLSTCSCFEILLPLRTLNYYVFFNTLEVLNLIESSHLLVGERGFNIEKEDLSVCIFRYRIQFPA